jgi:hypothetical protein
MSTEKYAFVQNIFETLISYWQVKGYNGLAAHIGVPYQTLMAWKKRRSIGDYAPFMDKGISKAWLETGEGEMLVNVEAYPHGTNKYKQHVGSIQQNHVSESSEELYSEEYREMLKARIQELSPIKAAAISYIKSMEDKDVAEIMKYLIPHEKPQPSPDELRMESLPAEVKAVIRETIEAKIRESEAASSGDLSAPILKPIGS